MDKREQKSHEAQWKARHLEVTREVAGKLLSHNCKDIRIQPETGEVYGIGLAEDGKSLVFAHGHPEDEAISLVCIYDDEAIRALNELTERILSAKVES